MKWTVPSQNQHTRELISAQNMCLLAPSQVLTRDSVTVSVDAVVYYRIYNPTVSVANVANAAHSTQLLAQTTLRNVLGTKNLGEILSDRDQISESMQVSWQSGLSAGLETGITQRFFLETRESATSNQAYCRQGLVELIERKCVCVCV